MKPHLFHPWFLLHIIRQLNDIVLIFGATMDAHHHQRLTLFICENFFLQETLAVKVNGNSFMIIMVVSVGTHKVQLVQVHITTCCVSFSQRIRYHTGFLLTYILKAKENLKFFFPKWTHKRVATRLRWEPHTWDVVDYFGIIFIDGGTFEARILPRQRIHTVLDLILALCPDISTSGSLCIIWHHLGTSRKPSSTWR